MRTPSIPFTIRVLAPFAVNLQVPWQQPPVAVDLSSLDQAVKSICGSAYFPLPLALCPAGGLEITVSRMKDFHPDGMIQNNPFLRHLLEAGRLLSDHRLSVAEKKQGLEQFPDLPALDAGAEAKEAISRDAGALDNILNMVAMPGEAQASGQATKPTSGGTAVDGIIQAVLAHVYSDNAFREAEAAWRGLQLLLRQGAGAAADFRVEIIPATLETIEETIGRLTVSQINDLPSLVIVDLPFDNTPHSIHLLEKVAAFAEMLMAPALACASPRLMDLDSWTDLNRLPFLPNYLQSPHFAKFNRLKAQPEADWVALACNRVLARYPYGKESRPRTVSFEEPEAPWLRPVWAVSALIVKSYAETGWPTRFTEWQAFQLRDLAVHFIGSDTAVPVEALMSEDRMDQLRRIGLIPLAAMANRDVVFVPMETTLGGASLAYQLFASRVTQLLLWCRDNLSPDLSGPGLEEALKRTFFLFWEKSGHPRPESIEITAGDPDTENRIPLRLDLQPSRRILPSGEGLALEFNW